MLRKKAQTKPMGMERAKMELFCKRIWDINDVVYVVSGIRESIEAKVYSDLTLMETLRLISSKDTRFYIFFMDNQAVGFGAIKNNNEVHKVFVNKDFRGRGFGIRISLWLKRVILKNGYLPVCWIKRGNDWSKVMARQGMIETDSSYTWNVQKYILRDFEAYVKAIMEYGINNIVYVKKLEAGK